MYSLFFSCNKLFINFILALSRPYILLLSLQNNHTPFCILCMFIIHFLIDCLVKLNNNNSNYNNYYYYKLFEALKLMRIIYTVLMQNRSCFTRKQTCNGEYTKHCTQSRHQLKMTSPAEVNEKRSNFRIRQF